MDSRRSVLKKILVGTAAAAVPATGAAATRAVAQTLGTSGGEQGVIPDGPAPWWLVAPVGVGTPLGLGWYVHHLGPVERGAAVLTLRHTSGRDARVHLCGHRGQPQGMAHTALIDLVLMDGGSGSMRTDEKLGRVILGLAQRVRANETSPTGDLKPVARMMTHADRVEAFGADAL